MQSKVKYLTKNVGLFALSGFIPKALSFLLVPLYTSVLSTADYGISDLISTTVLLLVPILTVDIQDAVMRFSLDENAENCDVLSIGLLSVARGTVILIAASVILALLRIPGLKPEYLSFTVITFFATSSNNVLTLFCRGIDAVKHIAVASILNSALTLSCNVLFLLVFKWGLIGYLIANAIGSATSVLYLFFGVQLFKYCKRLPSLDLKREMYSYSFPLIFSVVAWWINSASSRYIISWFCGVAVSGVYAVAYKIPGVLSMFGNVFSQAWSISAIKEYDPNDEDAFFGSTFELMIFAMALTCSMIMLFNIPISKILFAKEFFAAWRFVPFLLVAVVFDILCQFMGSVIAATKNTKGIMITTVSGALVTIALNFALVPFYGAMGAAIGSMFGYLVVFIARLIALQRYMRIKANWKRIGLTFIILGLCAVFASMGLWGVAAQVVLLGVLVLLHRSEMKKVMSLAANMLSSRF